MTKNHTPLPWRYDVVGVSDAGPNGVDVCEISTANNMVRVAEGLRDGDAALIVRAVNNHQLLVDCLQAVADYWAGGDVPEELDAQMRFVLARAKGEA